MGTITVIWFAVGFSLVFGEGNFFIGDFAHAALVGLEGTVWPQGRNGRDAERGHGTSGAALATRNLVA